MKRSNGGFTLIEVVVVITILGILAAFAVPKFTALDTQARIASLNGLAGSVKSAASLARGLSMATSSTTAVAMEGSLVNLQNNYPDATANGIANAVNSNSAGASGDFTFSAGGPAAPATWTKIGAPNPAACEVAYTPAPAGSRPTVAVATGGC